MVIRQAVKWLNRPLPGRAAPWLAFGVCALVLLAGFIRIGVRPGSDSYKYARWGSELIQIWLAGDWGRLFDLRFWYQVPSLVLGGGLAIFGRAWLHAYIILNILMFSTVVAWTFKVWHRLGIRLGLTGLVLGLLLFLGLPDVPQWNYYPLTDVMFLFVTGLFWFLLVGAVWRGVIRGWVWVLLGALFSMVVKPTGVILLGFWVVAAMFVWLDGRLSRRGLLVAVFVLVPALAALVAWPYLVYLKSQGIPAADLFISERILRYYLRGEVIHDRLETFVAPPQVYLDFVRITLQRFAQYFIPVRTGYSLIHNLVAVSWGLFCGWMCLLGWKGLIRQGDRARALAWLLVLFTLYMGLFHAMIIIAYDWQYQLPAMVSIWLLAGFGVASLLRGGLTPREAEVYSPGSK